MGLERRYFTSSRVNHILRVTKPMAERATNICPNSLSSMQPLGRRESDFALERLVECHTFVTERVRLVTLRWHSSGSEVRHGLPIFYYTIMMMLY
jgi:hypothetical protein